MSDLGDMLREARYRRGVSLEDVAAATRIKESFLSALETGEYSLLPGPAYITGFLRNYASYLGLHPDDVVAEYYASRPQPQATVKAATRVLASGHQRQNRSRLYWIFGIIVLLLCSGYAIKQYNDSTAHAYTAPVNVTASGLGTISPTPATKHAAAKPVTVQLHTKAMVWVRVTVDGRRVYQGMLKAGAAHARWTGHHAIYLVTMDGAHIRGVFNGKSVGLLSDKAGVLVDMVTPTGWQRVS